jgi:hypothetical protein
MKEFFKVRPLLQIFVLFLFLYFIGAISIEEIDIGTKIVYLG